MKVLAVNAGSSSMKFQLFEMPEEKVLVSANFERIGLDGGKYSLKINGSKIEKATNLGNHTESIKIFLQELIDNGVLKSLDEIESVGHRVVHGSDKYSHSVIINDDVIGDIESYCELAPLHNPANLLGISAVKEVIPSIMNVAVFDTAFHQTMPKEAYIYPVPYDWYEKYGVRKYGFHGISHQYVSNRVTQIEGKQCKTIVCHLGNGASISAVLNGKCIETSMGFTPIAGITMGTRCGDIDPSIIPFVMKKSGKSIDEIMSDLNKKSGLLGMSELSSDSRDIMDAIDNGNEKAIMAQNIYVRKIVSFVSYYNVLLNGADVIAFTAGIGENDKNTRESIMNSLSCIGVIEDIEANNVRGIERLITKPDSKIKCYIIPTNEELMIVRETYSLSK